MIWTLELQQQLMYLLLCAIEGPLPYDTIAKALVEKGLVKEMTGKAVRSHVDRFKKSVETGKIHNEGTTSYISLSMAKERAELKLKNSIDAKKAAHVTECSRDAEEDDNEDTEEEEGDDSHEVEESDNTEEDDNEDMEEQEGDDSHKVDESDNTEEDDDEEMEDEEDQDSQEVQEDLHETIEDI